MKERYLVHDIAKFFGVTNDTIRYYDKVGIISPKKDKLNNYRYYDRGDIICFSYVFELRNIDLPLSQIKTMLNNSSLEYAANTMQEHEQAIEEKIKELQRLKSVVQDYKECFQNAIENYELLKVIERPVIIYKEIEPDGSLIENLKFFEKMTMMHVPLFTFCIDRDLFLSKEFYDDIKGCRKYFKTGLSLIDEENLVAKADFPAEQCKILSETKCLTSVIKFYTNKDYSSIIRIIDYIRQNNIEVVGSVMLRAISFKNNLENNYDFYEVYIPIK